VSVLLLSSAVLAGVVEVDAVDPQALDRAFAPRRVALLVGVQDYADPALAGLRFPAKDARDLGAVLSEPAVGGFDRVFVLEGAESTTAEAISHALDVATADLQRDDTFLLYLSGHGTLTLDPLDGSRLWFLPSDGRLDHPQSTGLAIDALEERVGTLPARRRVLVMDTCHNSRTQSGTLAGRSSLTTTTRLLLDGLRGPPPPPRSLREVSESEARLYAAQYHQPAMEDSALENGVYTHFLISALTDERGTADLDRDGLVDVAEAHDFARDHTVRYTGGVQVPRAEYRIVGREEIYLSGNPDARSAAEQALLSACDELLAQARLLVDGVPRGALPGLHAVDPGRHRIELQTEDGRLLARQNVNLDAGATLPLESLLVPRAPALLLSVGPLAVHGPGQATRQPMAGEFELGVLDPFAGIDRLRPEVHLRASAARGVIAEQGDAQVTSGDVALGGSLGWRQGALSAGPQLELMLPWRTFTNETGEHRQATLTATAGARVMWAHRRVVLRYDARFAPYLHDAAWTSLWYHGVALGLRTTTLTSN